MRVACRRTAGKPQARDLLRAFRDVARIAGQEEPVAYGREVYEDYYVKALSDWPAVVASRLKRWIARVESTADE